MVPSTLTGQAYQIVDNAMKTGGRGSVTKTSDYSGISDAFMKKAQLETNIANMKMNENMNRAQLMADLDMNKANLYMESARLQQADAHFQQQRQDAKDADKMSPFEQITGVLAGAASGAAGGAAFGPKGAIIGGVLGGVTSLGAGNSRKAQATTLTNIGAISSATRVIKGYSDERKAKDAGGELLSGVADVAGALRKNAPGTPEYERAQAKLDNYVSTYSQEAIKAGVPMQQVYENAAAIRKEAMGGFNPNDPKQVASRKMQSLVAEAKADPIFTDPEAEGHTERVQQFQSQMGSAYTEGWGKTPTRTMGQQWVGSVDAGVAQAHFGGQQQPAQTTEPINSMPSGGGGNVRSDSGVSNTATAKPKPTQGTSTLSAQEPRPSQDGTMVPNSVMAPAPSPNLATNAWGVEMDNTETMLRDISQKSVEMSKDPSIAAKALHQDPADLEMEPPSTREKIYRGVDKALGFGTEDGKPGLIKHFGNRADQMAAERKQDLTERQLEMQAEQGPTPMPEPTIKAQNPETAAKEEVFKTTTDPDVMMDTFQLRGKFDNSKDADKVMGLANAGLEVNNFRQKVYEPKIQAILMKLTPEQRRLYQDYMQGLGEEAMVGENKALGGSAAGVSAQKSWGKFERSVKLSNQGRGDRNGLTAEELKTLNGLQTQATALGRQIGMGYNTGAFSNQDAKWAVDSVFNMFEQDPDVAAASNDELQDMIWNKFYMTDQSYQSSDTKLQKKIDEYDYKQQNKTYAPKNNANDELIIFN